MARNRGTMVCAGSSSAGRIITPAGPTAGGAGNDRLAARHGRGQSERDEALARAGVAVDDTEHAERDAARPEPLDPFLGDRGGAAGHEHGSGWRSSFGTAGTGRAGRAHTAGGVELRLPFERDRDRPFAIGLLAAPFVPLITHQTGPAK